MKEDEIIELARQAGLDDIDERGIYIYENFDLQDFAKLVEAKVEARYMQLFLDPENQPTQFGTATQEYREQEILEEREACAKLCDDKVDAEYATGKVDHNEMGWTQSCAIAIRARGEA